MIDSMPGIGCNRRHKKANGMDTMADDKMKSIRSSLKAIEAFEEISASFESQGQAFEAVVASYSLYARAERSPGFRSSIEAVAMHTARIQELYSEAVKAIEDAREAERHIARSQADAVSAAMEALAAEKSGANARAEAAEKALEAAKAENEALKAHAASLEAQLKGQTEASGLLEELKAALAMAKQPRGKQG